MNYREALDALRSEGAAPVYLLFGEEAYLRKEFIRRLRAHLEIPRNDPMRRQHFDGSRLDEALAACMMPTFDRKTRLIVVDNPPAILGGAGEEDLLQYAIDPNDSTVLVLTTEKVDRRRRMFTRMKSARTCRLVDCAPLRGKDRIRWIAARMKVQGKTADPEAVRMLGGLDVSLGMLEAEIDKLSTYTGERTNIEVSDVLRVVNVPAETSIFTLVDAVGSSDTKTAVSVMGEILAGGAEPLQILGMVARQIRIIWHVHHALRSGGSARSIAAELGQHPFVVEKCVQQSRNFDREDLERCLELILVTDIGIKRGWWSAELGVQRLVTVLASPDLHADQNTLRQMHAKLRS